MKPKTAKAVAVDIELIAAEVAAAAPPFTAHQRNQLRSILKSAIKLDQEHRTASTRSKQKYGRGRGPPLIHSVTDQRKARRDDLRWFAAWIGHLGLPAAAPTPVRGVEVGYGD